MTDGGRHYKLSKLTLPFFFAPGHGSIALGELQGADEYFY